MLKWPCLFYFQSVLLSKVQPLGTEDSLDLTSLGRQNTGTLASSPLPASALPTPMPQLRFMPLPPFLGQDRGTGGFCVSWNPTAWLKWGYRAP